MLSASSPDDEALVLGAKYFGFEFINRIDSSAIINTWDVTAPPLPAAQKGSRSPLNSGVLASSSPAAAAAAGRGSDGDITRGKNACFSSENVTASPHPKSVVAVSPAGGASAATATTTTPVEDLDKLAVIGAAARPPLSSPALPAPSASSTNNRDSAQAEGEGRSEQGPQGEGGVSRATTTEGPGGSAANVTPASYEVGEWVDG